MESTGILASYNVKILFKKDAKGNVSVDPDRVSSNISGFTLWVTYDHQNADIWISGSLIKFTVIGTTKYNIMSENIGTIQEVNITITGSYDTRTGNYIIDAR
ncbi:hypothetical protein D3C80_1539610 [compost metagenome]